MRRDFLGRVGWNDRHFFSCCPWNWGSSQSPTSKHRHRGLTLVVPLGKAPHVPRLVALWLTDIDASWNRIKRNAARVEAYLSMKELGPLESTVCSTVLQIDMREMSAQICAVSLRTPWQQRTLHQRMKSYSWKVVLMPPPNLHHCYMVPFGNCQEMPSFSAPPQPETPVCSSFACRLPTHWNHCFAHEGCVRKCCPPQKNMVKIGEVVSNFFKIRLKLPWQTHPFPHMEKLTWIRDARTLCHLHSRRSKCRKVSERTSKFINVNPPRKK